MTADRASYPDIAIFFGRPVRSHRLAEGLRRRGFQVTVYNNRGEPGTYVHVPPSFRAALARVVSTRHQIYLTHFTSFPGLCLYLNALLRGLPYVFNAVGLMSATYYDRSLRWPWPRLSERWVYPTLVDRLLAGASRIVCNSQYLKRELTAQFPQYGWKMSTIYNGIEAEQFASGQPVVLDHVPSGAIKLLAVMSWDYENKALAARLLMDAMGIITHRYPEARLTIAAKTSNDRYALTNESYLATLQWKESIRIYYNRSDVPDLMASSDLFVYATPENSNDSLPRALLEAHAAGLPIVTTATAGCCEVVADSVTGFAVPYNAGALGRRVVELIERPCEREQLGRRGQARIQELFNWDRMAEDYASLFLQISQPASRASSLKAQSFRALHRRSRR